MVALHRLLGSPYGDGPCLERLGRILPLVCPRLPRGLKVTGSNGKGSTSTMAAAILSAHGLRTGLFTSPHLHVPNERVRLDGVAIPDADLERWAERVGSLAEPEAGGFELWTALAAGWFAEQRADAVVWEAGIGGRLDATKALPAPVTALVHVSLEHTKLLGDTREAIAADKAQLADPGSILIVGPDVPGFEETPPRTPLPDRLGMRGPFQRVNARVALAATEAWLHDRFDPHLATGALQTARSPLRFERVADDVIIDVAHNVAGVQAVLEAVGAEIEGPLVLLVGVSRDRDYASMVPLLASIADFAVCTSAQKKGAPAATIAAHCPVEHVVIDDVADALRRARHEAKHRSATVLVTGGLFLAAEAARAI